jgi:hypothetical protein
MTDFKVWHMEWRFAKMAKDSGKHSNTRKYEHHFASVSELMKGYRQWVESHFNEGFRMYLVTFKFNNIPGSIEYKRREMLKQVEHQFYPTLTKRVKSWPMKPSMQRNLPTLIAVPDMPVVKHSKKLSARVAKNNDGLHIHAIIAMPRTLRHKLRGCNLKKLIEEKQRCFIGRYTTVSDIDVERVKDSPKHVTDYVFKTAKRNPAIMDEVLILPKSHKDVDTHTQAILAAKHHEDELLRQKIHKLRHLWDRAASSHGRSALDDYMEAGLSLYREFKAEGIAPEKSQRMLKLAKVHNWRTMSGSIERIIQATSDAHETIARRMTLALRYGQRQKWPDIKQGLRENGGIVGCAEKFEALENKKTRLEKLDLAISKVLNAA